MEGKKILVIDDDPVGSTMVESRLKKAGYDVLRSLNGKHGLEVAQKSPPDLIILDVEMPEMNGYDFIKILRTIELIKATPVIVLTSHEENKPIFQRQGIKDYLVKPVNFDALLSKMEEVLTS